MYETVTDRVKLVGGPQLSSGQDCLVYLVDMGELVLIDNGCGPSWRQIRDNIRDAGYHPKAIHTTVLTHCHDPAKTQRHDSQAADKVCRHSGRGDRSAVGR